MPDRCWIVRQCAAASAIAAGAALAQPVIGARGAAQAGADAIGGWASSQVTVWTRPGVPPAWAHSPGLAQALAKFKATSIAPVYEGGFANAALASKLGLDRQHRVRVPAGTDAPALAAALRSFGALFERVELDPIGGIATIPDDPDFDLQWGMLNTGQLIFGIPGEPGEDVHVTPVWDFENGNPALILAVLDAGMDEHAEIIARLIPGQNVAANPDNDDTSDACISHGTHVAGIAAANGQNQQGIAGIDWRCRIMPVKVLESCSGPESFLAEGLIWATDHGADVINMSLQYFGGSQVLHNAVQYAHGNGVTLIAASGNGNDPLLAFPARWPETIAVGAINNVGDRWVVSASTGSNYGPELDVMAPGSGIWSLDDTAGYKFLSGTSMAAPHVSGTVCLVKSVAPELTPDELLLRIQQTAVDIDDPGFDNQTGFGRLDVLAAVTGQTPVFGDLDGDGSVGIGDLLVLLAGWGACPETCPPACAADLDGDCAVGIADLLALLAAWG